MVKLSSSQPPGDDSAGTPEAKIALRDRRNVAGKHLEDSGLAPGVGKGYKVVQNNSTLLMCGASGNLMKLCKGKHFVYLCGEKGTDCCSINSDNPCMSGFYSCGNLGGWGSGKPSCCRRQ